MKKLLKSLIVVSLAASCIMSLSSCRFINALEKLEKSKNSVSSSESSGSSYTDTEGSDDKDSSSYSDYSSSSGSYSDSSTSSAESKSDSSTSSAESKSDSSYSCTPGGKLYKSVDELFGSSAMESMLEKTEEQINSSSDQFKLDITVKSDAIIYDYKFNEQIPEDGLDVSREIAEKSFQDSATVDKIKPLMKLMVQYVEYDNPKVVMKYTNADGSLIFEKTFDKSLLDE